jgi:flavocytochrome c
MASIKHLALNAVSVLALLAALVAVGPQRLPFFSTPGCSKQVIVIGGGLAGLSAAIEAANHGACVVVFERNNQVGGNSAKASSGMNAILTPTQKKHNVSDSRELFIEDTERSSFTSGPVVETLVDDSTGAYHFLSSLGADLSQVIKIGGHSRARTHRCDMKKSRTNVGMHLIRTVMNHIEKHLSDKINILSRTKVKDLLQCSVGQVCGVLYEKEDGVELAKFADNVVIATGGFGGVTGSGSMMEVYAPQWADLGTTNGDFASGDGIRMCEDLGAELIGMEWVQLHPTCLIDPIDRTNPQKILGAEAIRGAGAVILCGVGERIVDELAPRDVVSRDIMAQCVEGDVLLVLNQRGSEKYEVNGMINFYRSQGLVVDCDGFEELANTYGLNYDTVKRSLIDDYEKEPEILGKATRPIDFREDDKLHVMLIHPCVHYTMGGVRIDELAHVQRKNGTRINGLYAVGETIGGLHGHNRLGGSSLLDCVVYGRIAGRLAASE